MSDTNALQHAAGRLAYVKGINELPDVSWLTVYKVRLGHLGAEAPTLPIL